MKTNQDCSCGNVYVNYCCPDGNGGASFLGTKVYVDSRNTNESPDGSVNNPFATLEDAFAYVDSTDEDYVVNIINAGEKPSSIEYTFAKKGNLGIVGDLTYNIQYDEYLHLSLRFQEKESVLCVNGLRANLIVYGVGEVYINDILSQRIDLYDTQYYVRINNCRSQQGECYVELDYEKSIPVDERMALTNLLITNSSLHLVVNQLVYYGWAMNSYFSEITSYVDETMIQFVLNGCSIDFIDNSRFLESSPFAVQNSIVRDIAKPETLYSNTDMYLDYKFETTNYTPIKNTLLSHLEALDKKIGELQARFDSL